MVLDGPAAQWSRLSLFLLILHFCLSFSEIVWPTRVHDLDVNIYKLDYAKFYLVI